MTQSGRQYRCLCKHKSRINSFALSAVQGGGRCFFRRRTFFFDFVGGGRDESDNDHSCRWRWSVSGGCYGPICRHSFTETFGSEAFWGDALQLHKAIAGEKNGGVGPGVSPKTALSVGLKVDVDALPDALKKQLNAGKVNLDDPATTVALLKL